MGETVIMSTLPKTWIFDLDGTLLKHNGYKIDGVDTVLPGVREYLESIPKEDHIFKVTVLVTVSPQFFGWITGIGTGVRIEGPPEVREEYREYLKAVLELY